jgi:subtilisin family serine protease
MAGIIAAGKARSEGVLGIAPDAKILPIKDRSKHVSSTAAQIECGIQTAVDQGAKVINLALGTSPPRDSAKAIQYALDHDVVIVASAGNTTAGDTEVMWPAKVPGVIAVTGVDKTGVFWSGSVQGPEAVVAAPATDIIATDSRLVYASGYSSGSGTSDATAIVSGVAALIRSKYPSMSAANVINRIITTADDAGPPGRDPQYGFGTVNALRALTANVPEVASNPLGQASPTSTFESPYMIPFEPGDGGGVPTALIIGIVAGTVAVLGLGILFSVHRRRRSTAAQPLQNVPYPGMAQPGAPIAHPGQPQPQRGSPTWPPAPPGPLPQQHCPHPAHGGPTYPGHEGPPATGQPPHGNPTGPPR